LLLFSARSQEILGNDSVTFRLRLIELEGHDKNPPHCDRRPLLVALLLYAKLIEITDAEWFMAQCPDVPEANGQGRTPEEAKKDLGRPHSVGS
jgi:hypothetical protein